MQDVQRVQQLTFVFVQPLYLDVEYRIGIDGNVGSLFDIVSKSFLILALYLEQFVQNVVIALERHQFFQFVGLYDKLIAYQLLYQVRQQRIGFAQPAAVSYAVGDVGKLFGSYLIIVFEYVVFQYLAVQRRNAVYGMRRHQAAL